MARSLPSWRGNPPVTDSLGWLYRLPGVASYKFEVNLRSTGASGAQVDKPEEETKAKKFTKKQLAKKRLTEGGGI